MSNVWRMAFGTDSGGEASSLLDLVLVSGRPFPWRPSLRKALAGRVMGEWLDDILIVSGELVANAVEHGRGEVSVHVGITEAGDVVVSVTDSNVLLPRLLPQDPQAPRGRGLLIVDSLASEWGTGPTASGKVVWARFAVSPTASSQTART